MRRNLRLSILYDDWWVVNETRGLLRIFWKFSRKIVASCRYWVCSTVSGPVPLWCGLLVSCQLHPLVPHHSRQRDHNPDQGTVIIRSWESWHIKKMGMIMICLSEVLKSIAGYFCLFCCWSWRGSTQCHHLISTMIRLRENDNKMVQSWELHLSWLQSLSWTKWCWQPGQEVTGGGRLDAELFNILVHAILVTGGGTALYVARFGLMKVLKFNFYQLQAVTIMDTIAVCKSNMVSGR